MNQILGLFLYFQRFSLFKSKICDYSGLISQFLSAKPNHWSYASANTVNLRPQHNFDYKAGALHKLKTLYGVEDVTIQFKQTIGVLERLSYYEPSKSTTSYFFETTSL